jgi:hypothetical protein
MAKIVQVKTPLELQEFLWKDGALVRAEEAAELMYVTEALSAESKTLLTKFRDRLASPQLQPMWS